MARLTTDRERDDFIGVEIPKEFVAELLDAAIDASRVTDEAAAEAHRIRVSSDRCRTDDALGCVVFGMDSRPSGGYPVT